MNTAADASYEEQTMMKCFDLELPPRQLVQKTGAVREKYLVSSIIQGEERAKHTWARGDPVWVKNKSPPPVAEK